MVKRANWKVRFDWRAGGRPRQKTVLLTLPDALFPEVVVEEARNHLPPPLNETLIKASKVFYRGPEYSDWDEFEGGFPL